MSLICLRNITVNIGFPLLLDNIQLTIEPNERIGLIGRNGTGKSTLLKIIQGHLTPDKGVVEYSTGCTVASLPQEIPTHLTGTVYEVVATGLGDLGKVLIRYQALTEQSTHPLDLDALHELQNIIEKKHGWNVNQHIQTVLSRLNLNGSINFSDCSGGLKRRVLLAKALVQNPSLLLLDEPTNHLDIEAIEWLENALTHHSGAVLFITHDRSFLQKIATRIIEIDRGQLTSWPGNYQQYLQHKQTALEAEEKAYQEFDKKLAQEEIWIRKGIKARRTRNEGRVRALEQMRHLRKQRQNRQGQVDLTINKGAISGKQVLVAEDITFSFENKLIIKDFSTRLMRGDKVGIIGPNGCGKTTLLSLLLGSLKVQNGSIKYGTQLQIAYFDQYRAQLEEDKNVVENLAIGTDTVSINGKSQHVMSYLQDFLFSPQRARTLVKQLSGGERNRLLLARLFLQPCNVLVMDEPTNDLDMETLDLLEELLLNFQGTLLLISHDRAFLDNVTTTTWVFEGGGIINEYIGGYNEWRSQSQEKSLTLEKKIVKKDNSNRVKLSYKEQRELENLPNEIELLEQEQQQLQAIINAPEFYKNPADTVRDILQKLDIINKKHDQLLDRWLILEQK